MGADKDQLLHHYFEAVNDLYPPWRGEDILVKKFQLGKKERAGKKQDLKRDLPRIAVNVQVALDVEKKNDQASNSQEEEEEEEEDGAKKVFSFPFVFVKDLK